MPALKKAFLALTPGATARHLLHFASAKQSKTREGRIEQCMERSLDRKGSDDRKFNKDDSTSGHWSPNRICSSTSTGLAQGSCSTRELFGVVLPTVTRIRSRSFPLPVYCTTPSMFTSCIRY